MLDTDILQSYREQEVAAKAETKRVKAESKKAAKNFPPS